MLTPENKQNGEKKNQRPQQEEQLQSRKAYSKDNVVYM